MAIASGAYKKALTGNQQPKEVLVKIDRVTKKFDETVAAVDDVSLTINKGEIFALLGGSGSGKSTSAAHARRLRAANRRSHPTSMVRTSPTCRPTSGRST